MEPIKFYIGQESGIVVENKDFATSIFAEQYKQALQICQSIWNEQNKVGSDSSNIIAFCGNRGEGKTSCLSTIRNILSHRDLYFSAQDDLNIRLNIPENEFKVLEVVDPLFFDKNHNLIELLLGQMIAEIIQIEKQEDCNAKVLMEQRNDLLKRFEGVKRRLKILKRDSRQEEYDELENLDDLAAGVRLREELDSLFCAYARFFRTKKVVICLDDVDLNMTEGYQMAEEIRKYLSGLHSCIVMMALRVEQLEKLVMSYMRTNLTSSVFVADITIRHMAQRYVTKLLPLANRVVMPNKNNLAEKEICIYDGDKSVSPSLLVKDFVVELIYKKTRFIFVNGSELCPIVPTNLRALRHLIGELWSLNDANQATEEEFVTNKAIFKEYFYRIWTQCIDERFRKDIESIIYNDNLLTTNKITIVLLSKVCSQIKSEQVQNQNIKMMNAILNSSNAFCNVSVGDVFFLIRFAEQNVVTKELKNVLFFIKSFYSIKLYELYDIISSDEKYLFLDKMEDKPTIFRYDEQFQQVNVLQRFVNGSYFSFFPSAILPKEKEENAPRDIRAIGVPELANAFSSLKTKTRLTKTDTKNLHLCEFFALTTTHALLSGDIQNPIIDRTLPDPLYLLPHEKSVKYLSFNVLSIFYNIINVQTTYRRFNNFCSNGIDFYEFAKKRPDSILNKMLVKCSKKKEVVGHNLSADMHGLISDAIIRFSEIQFSIIEMTKTKRDKLKSGGNVLNIKTLLDNIMNTNVRLYPKFGEDISHGHPIKFNFLTPIIEFLDKEIKEEEFNLIFNSAQDEAKKEKVATIRGIGVSESVYNILTTIFGPDLKFIAHDFPRSGVSISYNISRDYPSLYTHLGGKSVWDTILPPRTIYKSANEAIKALSSYSMDISEGWLIEKNEKAKGKTPKTKIKTKIITGGEVVSAKLPEEQTTTEDTNPNEIN